MRSCHIWRRGSQEPSLTHLDLESLSGIALRDHPSGEVPMDHLPVARGFWRCHGQREWAAGLAYATRGSVRSFSFDDSMHAGTRCCEISERARDPRRDGPTYPGKGGAPLHQRYWPLGKV